MIKKIISFIFFITANLYPGIYTGNGKSGWYANNPGLGFYFTGVNKPFELVEDKTPETKQGKAPEILERIKTLSSSEISEGFSNAIREISDDPASIDAAEYYLLYKAELERRTLIAEETAKEAYKKLKKEKGIRDFSEYSDINEIKKNVRLGFFLSYSSTEKEERSRFGESLINYYSGLGFKIFVVVPSFSEKMDINESIINRVPDIIVDNDGRIASEFSVGVWPAGVAIVMKDGAIFNLYEGKESKDKINIVLMKQYKIYLGGDSSNFKHVNLSR